MKLPSKTIIIDVGHVPRESFVVKYGDKYEIHTIDAYAMYWSRVEPFTRAMKSAEELRSQIHRPIRITADALNALIGYQADYTLVALQNKRRRMRLQPWYPPIDVVEIVVALMLARETRQAAEVLNTAITAEHSTLAFKKRYGTI